MTDTTSGTPRQVAREKLVNKIDPVFWVFDRLLLEGLFRPPKKNSPGKYELLDVAEEDFLIENLCKHRFVAWCNIGLAVFLAAWGLRAIFAKGDAGVVVTGLLAPAMITGAAWYTLTFGGISEKFLNVAMTLTRWMFLAFSLSMTLLTALLCSLTPWPIGWFVLAPIYVGLYVASMLYDNLDGLKIGLDTTLLRFSRASLNYYQKHGLLTRDETEADVFTSDTGASSEEIGLFSHHISMLEHNLRMMREQRPLAVANHLIASCTDHLFKVLTMSLGDSAAFGEGDEFRKYLALAHRWGQDEVDFATISYLRHAIHALRGRLGDPSGKELAVAESTLDEFERLRLETVPQELADHLFVHVFQQLVSLMKENRHLLFQDVRSSAMEY